jgi:D-sedoheptulose 7-phosphate isomerase
MNIFESLQNHFKAVAGTLLVLNQYEIEKAVRILEQVKKDGAFVWIVGNGGSAATASHFANDLNKMCGIRAISVPDLTPTFLAYGNDEGWDHAFWRIVGSYARSSDVVVAISCSGESSNVLEVATHISIKNLIILTGNNEESSLSMVGAGATIGVPHGEIKVQEDIHLAICHAIVGALS